ncbi:hypothetical protein m02_10410, partial [Bartonella bovis m02]
MEGDGTGLVGVQMGSMEKLMMMGDVTFEGVTEGININGGGSGGSVMVSGMGTGLEGTTMTVKNSGSGVVGVVGIKVQDTEKINATVMGLKIVGSVTGSGSKGVEFIGSGGKGGKGKLNMTSVDVSGFETGVSASNGTLVLNGGSKITFTSGGTGLEVKDTANATMMGGKIVGDRSGDGTGVKMGGMETLMLTSVDISEVKMGVYATNGKLVMNGGSKITVKENGTGLSVSGGAMVTMMGNSAITIKENGTGLEVKDTASAILMGAVIKGDGKGTGMYGVKMMGTGKVKMDGVGILQVEKGVYVEKGTVEMMGTTIMVKSGGTGNGKGYGVGVGVSGGSAELMKVMNMGSITIKEGAGSYGVGVWGKATATLMGTEIVGSGKGTGGNGQGTGYGVYMGSEGEMMMDGVKISKVEKGVSVSKGTLKMNMGSITIKEGAGNYGVGVWGKATATLMGTKIVGSGTGYGVYGVQMTGTGKVEMNMVEILQVGVGVYATN